MNQRQIKRAKRLIDIINIKRTERHDPWLANKCITVTACGTMGCVWGDYVISMGGLNRLKLTGRGEGSIQTFGTFADYISRPTLSKLSWDIDKGNTAAVRKYFGFRFQLSSLFGTKLQGGDWETRYVYAVQQLAQAGVKYDPANLVFKES